MNDVIDELYRIHIISDEVGTRIIAAIAHEDRRAEELKIAYQLALSVARELNNLLV